MYEGNTFLQKGEKMKITKALLERLAEETGLEFDGNENDPRLHGGDEYSISTVFAHLMSKDQYKQMCNEINNFSISGNGFKVYTWNDASSYNYWKEQGEHGEANYIQISVSITGDANPKEIMKAVEDAFYEFSHYDNWDEFASQEGA